jgi:2-keto-4-pentenoate hydratase/2-oxohepta-3-ene-1,7-dioic acid hydratase in catechol pathway
MELLALKPRVVLSAEDNFRTQPRQRKAGLSASRPAVLEPIRRSDPAEDVWIVPRDPTSVSDGADGLVAIAGGQLDAGVALALVVARDAWRVPVEDAPDFIAGYAVALDVVRREVPAAQGYIARSYRGHTPIGAVGDQAPNGDAVLTLEIDGVERQRASIDEMVASPNQVLATITARVRLSGGDVILTGTPGGNAFDRDEGWLQVGSQVRASISGLSDLVVNVIADS